MDPVSIGIATGIVVGVLTIISKWRTEKSPKGRVRGYGKRARNDARKVSNDFKHKIKKAVKRY